MDFVRPIIEALTRHWTLIVATPAAYVLVFVLGLVAGWLSAKFFFQQGKANAEDRIQVRQERLEAIREDRDRWKERALEAESKEGVRVHPLPKVEPPTPLP